MNQSVAETIETFVEDVQALSVASFPSETERDIAISAKVNHLLYEIPLTEFIQFLQKDDIRENQVSVLSEALGIIFRTLPENEIRGLLSNDIYIMLLSQGIIHVKFEVRKVCLDELERLKLEKFANENDFQSISKSGLCENLALCLCDPEASVAQISTRIMFLYIRNVDLNSEFDDLLLELLLKSIGAITSELIQLLSGKPVTTSVNSILKDLSPSETSIYFLRCAHILSKASELNDVLFDKIETLGYFKSVIQILKGTDILMQLNVINLLTSFSKTFSGIRFFRSNDLANILLSMTNSGLLRDFSLATLVHVSVDVLNLTNDNANQDMIQFADNLGTALLRTLNDDFNTLLASNRINPTDACKVLALIGAFAGGVPGKTLEMATQLDDGSLLKKWMQLANRRLSESQTIAGIDSLSNALSVGAYNFSQLKRSSLQNLQVVDDISGSATDFDLKNLFFGKSSSSTLDQGTAKNEYEIATGIESSLVHSSKVCLNVCLRFFEEYKANPSLRRESLTVTRLAEMLLKQIELPIPEHQHASLKCLRVIALQKEPWGMDSIVSNPPTMSMLLNRTLILDKVGKEWRFAVIEALYHHPSFDDRCPDRMKPLILEFLKRGPFLGPSYSTNQNNSSGEPQVIVDTI